LKIVHYPRVGWKPILISTEIHDSSIWIATREAENEPGDGEN